MSHYACLCKSNRGRVHELADKYQSRTVGRIGESAELENAELDGAVIEASREQSVVIESCAELERELIGAVERVGGKVGGLNGAIKRCLEKAIAKVKEVAKRVEESISHGLGMSP